MYKNILINLPTNIGDAVLSLPVIDRLHANYSEANISLICSSRTIDFLGRHPFVNNALLYDKRSNIREKIKFSFSLRGKYDLVIDLKNSFLPVIIGAKHTSFLRNFAQSIHSKDAYLALIEKFTQDKTLLKWDFCLTEEEKNKWNEYDLSPSIFIACASLAAQKRYPYRHLKEVVGGLKKYGRIIILGQESDKDFYKDILFMDSVIDLTGKTKIVDLFFLIKNYARILVCVDSSILHIASYLNRPIVAMFGQNSVEKYGPWSEKFITLKRNDLLCVPCQKPSCDHNHDCMDIAPADVLSAVGQLISR